jgi:hypothetical protein
MMGLAMLFWIEQRCREIFPLSRDRYSCSLSVVLVGDFLQLPLSFRSPYFRWRRPLTLASRKIPRGPGEGVPRRI